MQNLCIPHIYTPQTMNANGEPSEYAFQAEFVTIFKHLLLLAYADLKYSVLVEVKSAIIGVAAVNASTFSSVVVPLYLHTDSNLSLRQVRRNSTTIVNVLKNMPSSITVRCTWSTCAPDLS